MNREEAISWIKQICAYLTAGNPVWRNEPIIESCNLAIEALEQSEQKKGKWIPKEDQRFHCSKCNSIAPKGIRWVFCPNCGADMRGEEE